MVVMKVAKKCVSYAFGCGRKWGMEKIKGSLTTRCGLAYFPANSGLRVAWTLIGFLDQGSKHKPCAHFNAKVASHVLQRYLMG